MRQITAPNSGAWNRATCETDLYSFLTVNLLRGPSWHDDLARNARMISVLDAMKVPGAVIQVADADHADLCRLINTLQKELLAGGVAIAILEAD